MSIAPAPAPSRSLPALLGRTAAAGALGVAVLGGLPGTAAAEEPVTGGGPALAELEVVLSGPADARAGDRVPLTVAVSNVGKGSAPSVRVTPVLPAGLEVVAAPAVDGWTCVMGGGLSCQLDAPLAGGSTAPALPFDVAVGEDVRGPQQLSADAYQGEDGGALRITRGSATVLVSGRPTDPPTTPPAPPATTAATTAAVAKAPAPAAPVRTARAATAAPVRAAAPARTSAPAPATADADAGPVEEVPASLPFADEATADDSTAPAEAPAEQQQVVLEASRTPVGDGVDGWLVALFCTTFVVFGYCVVAAIAKSRRQLV